MSKSDKIHITRNWQKIQKLIRFRIIIQQYKLISSYKVLRLLKRIDMQPEITLHLIQNNFKLRIINIAKFYQFSSSTYFTAVTQLGSMTLVVEKHHKQDQQANSFLRTRNCFINKFSSYFPLILQQNIVQMSGWIFCFTLIQLCKFYEKQQKKKKQKLRIDHLSNLVKGFYSLAQNNFQFQSQLKYSELLYCVNSSQINLDFTCIRKKENNNQRAPEMLQKIKDLILFMFKNNQKINSIRQINLIHDKLYLLVPELIKKAEDLLQLLIMLNLDREIVVQIELTPLRKKNSKMNSQQCLNKDIQKVKTKRVHIRQLQGKQRFMINNKYYDLLIFLDGRCINCLQQLSQDDQKDYIKPGFHYKLHKMQNLYIECVQSNQTLEDQIIVCPPVQKIQFISFIIFYIKCIEPIILSISYMQRSNTLCIEYMDKKKHQRLCKIVFYQSYIVKEEEITMLLQRCKLRKCKLDLRFMKINDTLLMFLANFEKTTKIIELHLSDCYGLTDNGINILLVSPFSKNLQAISLILDDGLMQSAVQLLNTRPELKILNIQRNSFNKQHQHKTQISISKMKLAVISSKGIKISLNNLNTDMLKILKITQIITVEQLKLLRNLRLTQLKVRIIQLNKKSIIQSTSSFLTNAIGGKTNPVKYFADGPSSNTLKSLDLSDSNVKFTTVKYMFWMMELEKLYLDNCQFGNQFEPISAKVLVLSLVNTQISIQSLSNMLHKTPMLHELNIIYNEKIWREQIYELIITKKMMIKNLMICEKCYSNRLIQSTLNVNQPFQLIGQVSLYVQDMVNIQMQGILYSIMLKIAETTKILNFLTTIDCRIPAQEDEQIKLQFLLSRVVYFLKMSGKKLSNYKNIRINDKHLQQMIQKQIQIPSQSANYIEIIFKDKATFISIQSMDDQPIDKLTQRIVSVINRYPSSHLILCIKDNRVIPKQIVKMLAFFCKNNLTQINFINCTFKLGDVIQWIFQFPNLVVFNEGIVDVIFPSGIFVGYSYRFLKFCMNLRFIRQLSIECSDLDDYQVFYSVIEHIIEKNKSHLIKLSIKLNNIQINLEFDTLMQKIFVIEQLNQLEIIINNDNLQRQNKIAQLSGINKLCKLKKISLKTPVHTLPHINIRNIQHIFLDFSYSSIQENQINKIIRGLANGSLRSMDLNFQNSAIISPHKIFSFSPNSNLFEKLLSVQNLILNFQFCNLKQYSLYEALRWISKLPKLKTFTLNISFAISNLSEMIKHIHQIAVNGSKQSQICVISVTANSKDFQYNRQLYKQLGVQFVF